MSFQTQPSTGYTFQDEKLEQSHMSQTHTPSQHNTCIDFIGNEAYSPQCSETYSATSSSQVSIDPKVTFSTFSEGQLYSHHQDIVSSNFYEEPYRDCSIESYTGQDVVVTTDVTYNQSFGKDSLDTVAHGCGYLPNKNQENGIPASPLAVTSTACITRDHIYHPDSQAENISHLPTNVLSFHPNQQHSLHDASSDALSFISVNSVCEERAKNKLSVGAGHSFQSDCQLKTYNAQPKSGLYLESPRSQLGNEQLDIYEVDGQINRDSNFVDFFSSLELQSRWVGDARQQEDDRLDHQKALRIASILNELAFSSDTEDFLPSDADDLLASDLEDVDLHDAETPTGGKWKPVQSPAHKNRGKFVSYKTERQHPGKWKPSGKLHSMKKAKEAQAAQPVYRSKGKRMSGKLAAMKKLRAENESLQEKEGQVKWKPGERLRATAGTWRRGQLGADPQPCTYAASKTPTTRGAPRRRTVDIEDEVPGRGRISSERETAAPLDLTCQTCNTRLSSHGHYVRHLKSQEHAKRSKAAEKSVTKEGHQKRPDDHDKPGHIQTSLDDTYSTQLAAQSLEQAHKMFTIIQAEPTQQIPYSVGDHLMEQAESLTPGNSSSQPVEHTDISDLNISYQIVDDTEQMFTLTKTNTETMTLETPIECTICVKSFKCKYSFARHLATNFHQQRARCCSREMLLDESVQVLLLRQSKVQCLVCSFYSTNAEYLVAHLTSEQHTDRVAAMIGPLLCVRCKFACTSNNGMLEHLQDPGHEQQVQTSSRPLIIKESRTRIPCPRCNGIIQSAARLKVHLQSCKGTQHTVSRKQKLQPVCSYCNKQFASLYGVTIHVRRKHTKEKPFACTLCDVAYADNYTLGIHERSLAHLKRTGQQVIPLSFDKSKKRRSKFKCRYCDFTAKLYADLKPHYFSYHATDALYCDTCNVNFVTAEAKKQHNKTWKHKRKTKAKHAQFSCKTCGKVCKDPQRLQLHELTHSHPITEKELAKLHPTGVIAGINNKYLPFIESIKSLPSIHKVQCPECKKNTSRANIYAHLRMHEGIKVFQCPYCAKSLVCANSLKQHLEAHLGIKDHKCDKCDKVFQCQSKLREHINLKHTANQLPLARCKTCGEGFPSAKALHKHRHIHDGLYQFKCSFSGCFYTTKYKHDLMTHLKSHSSERNYLCNLCGFRAKHKSSLTTHMKTHSGERKFTCEYCDYKATTAAHLRRHMRIHIGVKPFACPYCPFRCNILENLHKHVQNNKKHAGKPVYPCKLCDYGTSSAREFRNHLVGNHDINSSQIGVLTSYCGIYDKSQDPHDIPEGACALPVREKAENSKYSPSIEPARQVPPKPNAKPKKKYNKSDVKVREIDNTVKFPVDDSYQTDSVMLTVATPITNVEGVTEMQDMTQIFPNMQALMKHLQQQQITQVATDLTTFAEEPCEELTIQQGQEEVIIQSNDLDNEIGNLELSNEVTIIIQ